MFLQQRRVAVHVPSTPAHAFSFNSSRHDVQWPFLIIIIHPALMQLPLQPHMPCRAPALRPQIYTRPTYEYFEIIFAHHGEHPLSLWNISQRAAITTTYMALVTVVCCAVPFFIDFVALV